MSYELDLIDTNCNNCTFMKRDIEKFKSFNDLHAVENGGKGVKARRINYGFCTKKQIEVSFIPNHCTPENAECFKHRRFNN